MSLERSMNNDDDRLGNRDIGNLALNEAHSWCHCCQGLDS